MIPAVDVNHVTHVYVNGAGASLVLKRIELSIAKGEFVSLVGPSGCGKTTLLSIMAGLITPTEGTVHVFGQPVVGPTPKVGYMLQQDFLFPWRTISENAMIGLEIMGQLTKAKKEFTLHLLKELGLSQYSSKYPSELSGGMRQRVALVRTLTTEPDILFLDEPFSALDYRTKLQLEDLVFQTLRDHHKTAILVTHDIAEALAMSNRVIVLEPNPGKIRKEIEIPNHIANALPLQAREQAGFQDLFRTIWKEFEVLE